MIKNELPDLREIAWPQPEPPGRGGIAASIRPIPSPLFREGRRVPPWRTGRAGGPWPFARRHRRPRCCHYYTATAYRRRRHRLLQHEPIRVRGGVHPTRRAQIWFERPFQPEPHRQQIAQRDAVPIGSAEIGVARKEREDRSVDCLDQSAIERNADHSATTLFVTDCTSCFVPASCGTIGNGSFQCRCGQRRSSPVK